MRDSEVLRPVRGVRFSNTYDTLFLFLVYLASYFDPVVFFFFTQGRSSLLSFLGGGGGGDFRLFVFGRNTDLGGV